MTNISFPGLGINNFSIDPVAIRIGGFSIRWYALFIVTGMILNPLQFCLKLRNTGRRCNFTFRCHDIITFLEVCTWVPQSLPD